ncbi:MAG: hypothetical protein AB7O67_14805 [Vicinamibacterales bacterium]
MDVTRDVVLDLLPLYQSGEASADTRRLVEAFIAHDPPLARLARQSTGVMPSTVGFAGAETVRQQSLQRTRQLISRRQTFLAGAILLTLFPLAFSFAGGEVIWMMWRDEPATAFGAGGGALVCWVNYFRLKRRLEVAGL